ncbi:MAG: thiol oxidoreductase [Proteobacteria bacterium]|nr:thiol oxidoreductase [Pseudomonadota bacterium]
MLLLRSSYWALFVGFSLQCTLAACGDTSGLAALEPGEETPGGETTNTLLLGANAFTMPADNITDEHEALFFSGNSFFNQSWVQAPSSTESRDGLGPLFNARSCAACHFKDGRGRPPLETGEAFMGILLRLSVEGQGPNGEPIAEPTYGGQLQPFSIPNVAEEGTPSVEYTEIRGEFSDGEAYTLLSPRYTISNLAYGPMSNQVKRSPRVAPAVIGLGLLEAIGEDRLAELEDPDDADGDGISGRINRVWDVTTEQLAIGRFGWKAEQPSVRQQSAGAFVGDMGITSSLFPSQNCTSSQTDCGDAISGGDPEIPDRLLDRVETYARLLAVPARQRFDDETVLRGKLLFSDIGCASCHTPSHQTGSESDLPEVRDQTIWPYTDLLLHDMGEELSDERPTFGASGREWRTPPLWGLRFYKIVNDHDRLLHDGRARGVTEAILWHGGESEKAREAFRHLPVDDRQALVQFVESL